MAFIYEAKIPAHKSIYVENARERELRVQYSMPDRGTNLETGILFLIPAYGGNLDSNVYQKMRREFPEKYNLIVIQCDYFGIEYMGTMGDRLSEFLETDEKTEVPDKRNVQLEETLYNCNDMGIMQAVDILRAGLDVIHKLSTMGVKMNFGKIIAYGSSHGSYLGYLVNRLCPGLFKLVIDNSAYCLPNYLYEDRPMYYRVSEMDSKAYGFSKAAININYLISRQRELFLPNVFYDLNFLYSDYENQCMILSFHGVDDKMVSIDDKKVLISNIKKASLIEISGESIDGRYFKSSEHGLGVELLNLYEAVDSLTKDIFVYKDSLSISAKVLIEREGHKLSISYEGLEPHITWTKAEETNKC